MKLNSMLLWITAVILGTIAPIIYLSFHNYYDNTFSENSRVGSIPKFSSKLNDVVKKTEYLQAGDSRQRMKTMSDPFCGIDQEATFNVTQIVLKELEQGFFAVANENSNGSSTLDAVCVSEPTVLECLESGFASLLLMTLDHVSYCRIMGIENVVIHWRNCQTACTKDPRVDSWPAYFESSNSGIELKAKKVICLGGVITGEVLQKSAQEKLKKRREPLNGAFKLTSLLDVSFRKRTSLPGFKDGALITDELRDWARRLLSEHVRPKKSITARVETLFLNHMRGFTVLGVHARGTDHWVETENRTLPSLDAWIRDAEVIFQALESPKKIFLASDNYEIIDRFVGHFGKEKVIYTEARRAQKYASERPITGDNTNDEDPTELGSQVLVDILLLAKCGHFLHAESSVASLASYFNPDMELYDLGYIGTEEEASEIDHSVPTPSTFSDSSEDRTAEWEDEWNEELEALQKCFVANSPFSTCPDMAKGHLIARADVETFLAKS